MMMKYEPHRARANSMKSDSSDMNVDVPESELFFHEQKQSSSTKISKICFQINSKLSRKAEGDDLARSRS